MASDPAPALVLRVDDSARQRPPAAELSRWPLRRLSRVTSICVHQTAVAGGFGVTDRQIEIAHRERPSPDLPLEISGLLYRYRKTPYHALYSPRLRVSAIQWAPKWRTNHGNGANAYSLGWAYDGAFTTHHQDVLDVDGGRESLRHLIESALAAGCPLAYIEAHRQHDDDRERDPGPEIWRGIVVPIMAEFGLTSRDRTTGLGLAVPESWGA